MIVIGKDPLDVSDIAGIPQSLRKAVDRIPEEVFRHPRIDAVALGGIDHRTRLAQCRAPGRLDQRMDLMLGEIYRVRMMQRYRHNHDRRFNLFLRYQILNLIIRLGPQCFRHAVRVLFHRIAYGYHLNPSLQTWEQRFIDSIGTVTRSDQRHLHWLFRN